MIEPAETLDEYEYTRLDLIEPQKIIYRDDMVGAGSSRSAAVAPTTAPPAEVRATVTRPISGVRSRLSAARRR